MEMKIKIDKKSMDSMLGKLDGLADTGALVETVSDQVLENFKDFLDQMAPHRHKSARRLGANPTHHFEYASGRSGDGTQGTEKEDVSENGFGIVVKNTPGLLRAFGPVTVKPRKRKWLTIPIHKDAYGKSVGQLRSEGRKIFRLGSRRVLVEDTGETEEVTGKSGKKRKQKKLRPLFALCKETTAPRDRGLVPNMEKIKEWIPPPVRAAIGRRTRTGGNRADAPQGEKLAYWRGF